MFRRKTVVLAVTLALLLPWCAAAARPAFSLPARGETPVSLEQLRASFWSWLRNVWSKEGCSLDPGGAKEGCTIDTGGTKGGCGIDPSGIPTCGPTSASSPDPAAPTSNAEGGCTIDPDGSPCGGHQ